MVYFKIVPTVWCPTVWYILELFRRWDIFLNCSDSVMHFETWYTTLSEQFQNIPHCGKCSKIYHTVGTVSKYTTLSEQFQNIPHCRKSFKIHHTVGFWNCSDSMVYFEIVPTVWCPTVWYILELFRRWDIFWNCSDSVLHFETFKYNTLSEQFQNISNFRNSSKIYHTVETVSKYIPLSEQLQNIPNGRTPHCRKSFKIQHTVGTVSKYITVPTVLYILKLFQQYGVFWNCSDSVVSDRLVYFGTVPKVGYILKLFRQCGIFFPRYTTLSEQFPNIPHCRKSFKIHHTVGKVSKCNTLSEQFRVVYFGTVPTV
jgi:hypothetical protein